MYYAACNNINIMQLLELKKISKKEKKMFLSIIFFYLSWNAFDRFLFPVLLKLRLSTTDITDLYPENNTIFTIHWLFWANWKLQEKGY